MRCLLELPAGYLQETDLPAGYIFAGNESARGYLQGTNPPAGYLRETDLSAGAGNEKNRIHDFSGHGSVC